MNIFRWLYPGIGLKRWLVLFSVGLLLLLAGLAAVFNYVLIADFRQMLVRLFAMFPGDFWSRRLVGALLTGLGLVAIVYAVRGTVKSILSALSPRGTSQERLADKVYQRWHLSRGPSVVALGGGTGLSTLLRGLKEYTANITAVVTVADDGGSSGRLRNELGILPPGDIRNCLVSLAETEPTMARLFQHRFEGGSMAGHSLGNLFIGALWEMSGSFYEAVSLASEILAVRGQVLPSTLDNVSLRAEMRGGALISGESSIASGDGTIDKVELVPEDAAPAPGVMEAITGADLIVVGPGSLYTSLLPNLLVSGMREAIVTSTALKVFVVNIMTQPGETDGFAVSDHLEVMEQHVGEGFFDYLVVNTEAVPDVLLERYEEEGAQPVENDGFRVDGIRVVESPLLAHSPLVRHDPQKLARQLMYILLNSRQGLLNMRLFDIHLLQENLREKERKERS